MTLNQHQFQLQLFASGSEIKNMINKTYDNTPERGSYDAHEWYRGEQRTTHYSRTPAETLDQVWTRKEAESRDPNPGNRGGGVYDSIKNEGWRDGASITILHRGKTMRRLDDGHHRVAAAAALEAEGKQVWIPLNHRNETNVD